MMKTGNVTLLHAFEEITARNNLDKVVELNFSIFTTSALLEFDAQYTLKFEVRFLSHLKFWSMETKPCC
jgi:hypothetical protein